MPDIIHIDDLTAPALQLYANLTEAQLRNRLEPDKGIFIAESPKVIHVALDAGCEPLSLLTEEKHLDGIAAEIVRRCDGLPVYVGNRALLASLTGYELTRGVLCAMRRPRLKPVEEVCREARRGTFRKPRWCVSWKFRRGRFPEVPRGDVVRLRPF